MTQPTSSTMPGLTALLQASSGENHAPSSVFQAAAADEFFAAVLDAARRIKLMDGSAVNVEAVETDYVIRGYEFRVSHPDNTYIFWVGLNGTRLHFITTLDVDETEAENVMDLDTEEREMDGWKFLFLPAQIDEGMRGSIIRARVLLASSVVDAAGSLSETGLAWAVEVASLAQDLVRDCEVHAIGEHPMLLPAPHN